MNIYWNIYILLNIYTCNLGFYNVSSGVICTFAQYLPQLLYCNYYNFNCYIVIIMTIVFNGFYAFLYSYYLLKI